MSEHTREPWSIREEIDGRNAGWMTWIMGGDKGVAVCNNQARAATFRASKNESEANARHIVHCVNYHDRLREALREVTAILAWVAHGECRAIQDDPIMPSAQAQEVARALLAELNNLEKQQ